MNLNDGQQLVCCTQHEGVEGLEVTEFSTPLRNCCGQYVRLVGSSFLRNFAQLRADLAVAAVRAAAAVTIAEGSRYVVGRSVGEWMNRQAQFALVCTTRNPIRSALLDHLAS
jgi:hypothetical protein